MGRAEAGGTVTVGAEELRAMTEVVCSPWPGRHALSRPGMVALSSESVLDGGDVGSEWLRERGVVCL